MKALNIIEQAYRATIEEQDDTIVWLTHAMKGAGAELDVLLRGNAVNYAVRGQDASGVRFGAEEQSQPPRLAEDIAGLIGKGVNVYILAEDLYEHGITEEDLIEGPKRVGREELPDVFKRYDQIWHW